MSLTLYMHPLASFCQKVLIAFYENDTPFEPRIVEYRGAEHGGDGKMAKYKDVIELKSDDPGC